MLNSDPTIFAPLKKLRIVPHVDADYVYGNAKAYLAKFPSNSAFEAFKSIGWKIIGRVKVDEKIAIDIQNLNVATNDN